MARVANISFNFWSGFKIPMRLMSEILSALPADAEIIQMADDVTNGTSFMRIESSAFNDVGQAQLIPEIIVIINSSPMNGVRLDHLDMSGAITPKPPQGAPTTCTRAGCVPGNPCFLCHANANSTSLPVYATPSPWGQQAAYQPQVSGTYSIKLPPGLSVDKDALFGIKKSTLTPGCSHRWKSYTGLNETFEYCELPGCGVKRA